MAAAASSAAVAAVAVAAGGPAGAAVAIPALGLGGTAAISGVSSSTNFWDRLSSWPIFRLSGITGPDIWPFILTAFLIYVGIILITDGDMLFNAIVDSLSFGRCKCHLTSGFRFCQCHANLWFLFYSYCKERRAKYP